MSAIEDVSWIEDPILRAGYHRLQDGSFRCQLGGGPYHGVTVRIWPEADGTLGPLVFGRFGKVGPCAYTWGVGLVGKRSKKQVTTYVYQESEGLAA